MRRWRIALPLLLLGTGTSTAAFAGAVDSTSAGADTVAAEPAPAARALHAEAAADALVGLADGVALRTTLFGIPPAEMAELPAAVPVDELNIAIDGALPVPDVFWFNRRLRVWFSAQPGPAPLVIAIAGTGSGGDSGNLGILRRALYQAGYHVLTVPSPTFPRFIVAASSTGVAGDLRQDGSDLHRALRQVLATLPRSVHVTGVHVIGYSLGGAHAAMVKAIDAESGGVLGVQRVVMISPPVNLFASIGRLDRLFETSIGNDEHAFERLYLKLYARMAELYRASDALEIDQEFLLQAASRMLASDAEFAAAIALGFRLTLMNMFFAGDLYAGTGVVVDPHDPPDPDDSLTLVQRRLSQKPFADYFREVFAPFYLAQRPGATLQSLVEDNHLETIGERLRGSADIYAQANADDLILDASELQWLRRTMGTRIAVYPRGGHLGNIGGRQQVTDLLAMLAGRYGDGAQ